MAFSMVAVIILLVAGASVAVYGSSAVWSERSANDLASREKACQEAFATVRETAYMVAWGQLNSTGMDMDTARLSFLLAMNETVRSISPYRSGASLVTLDASKLDIGILTMPETDRTGSAEYPAFFCITGEMMVNVSDASGQLEQVQSIKDKVYLPVPLLSYLSNQLREATDSGASSLWNCVRYELSVLVQLRSLQDPAIAHDQSKTKMLLTDADVKNAVVLATILQQRAALRTYDSALLDRFINVPGYSIDPSTIRPYLEQAGIIDPADLFLILYGMNEFPVHDALAQALYASADMLALRYLDYLQVIDLVDFLEETVQTGVLIASDVISWVLGRDLISSQALDWVQGKMTDAGHAYDSYRYLWSGPVDWVIEMQPSEVYLYNSTGGRILLRAGGNYSVDVPEADIFASSFWKNTYVDYTKGTDEASDALIAYFKDLAQTIADRSGRIFVELTLDPFDGISPLDDLNGKIRLALEGNRGWFANAQGMVEVRPRPDPLGEAMAQALTMNEASLYGKETVLRQAFCSVTERMYIQMVEGSPELRDAPHEENLRVLRDAAQDPNWGLWPLLTSHYAEDTATLTQELISSFLQPEDANFIYKFLVQTSSGLVINTPCLESWVEGQLTDMMGDVLTSEKVLGLRTNVTLPTYGGLHLAEGIGPGMDVQISISTILSLDSISVIDPVSNPGSVPSLHITDLCNASHTPFQTSWDVLISGSASYKITVQSDSGMFPKMSRTVISPLETKFRLCSVTGWPMAGVDYRPDHTISGDALAVLKKIWSWLSDTMGQIGKGAFEILTWVIKANSMGANVLASAFEQFFDTSNTLIEMLRVVCEWLVIDGAGQLIELFTGGAPVKLLDGDYLGARICLELNQGDLALANAKNIVKMTFGFSIGSTKFSFSGRMIKVNGDYQFLANGTITNPDTRLNLVVDPFMTAFSHLIEVTGYTGGMNVQLSIPDVARFTTYSFSAADIPGLNTVLKNIPSPVPGTKFNINFGLQLKFATDAPATPVINEFESNPTGTDSGREWVEIFNPSGQVVTLSGWTLQTTHGKVRVDELGDVLLLPYSRVIYTLPGQVLDNGDMKTFPWADGIALIDPEGKRIDVAPTVMDKKNDGRTWQRADDASERWVFKTSTKGQPNSHIIYGPIDEIDLAGEMLHFFNDVLYSLESSGWSIDTLAYAVQSAMWSLMERLYDALFHSLVEAGVFLDAALKPVATDIASVGVTLSLKVDSEFIKQCWDWACRTIAKMILDPFSYKGTLILTLPLREMMEHSYLGVQFYVKLSNPESALSSFQAFVSNNIETSLKFFASIKMNLAATGVFLGDGIGKVSYQMGVGCTVTSMSIKGTAGNLMGVKQTEIWLFKLTLVNY